MMIQEIHMAAATISEERWFYDAEEVSSFFEIKYFTLLPLATITLTITTTWSGKMKVIGNACPRIG